jgi:limonene-1,2-epoxide hydrolase
MKLAAVVAALGVLPLACASAAAAPDPPPKAAAADGCRATGPVLFEIDHRVDPGAKLATSSVKVFATGAWAHDETDSDGKAAAQRTGCMAKPAVQQLSTTLHGAAWTVTTARMHCMARTAAFTVFQVDGKAVFTERLCSGQSLDEASRAKLDAATSQLNAELAKAP